MTFTPSQLIKIGRLFCDESHPRDTTQIASIMGCKDWDIYNALSDAREAYRTQPDAEREPVLESTAPRILDRPRARVPFVGFDPTEKSWWGKQ